MATLKLIGRQIALLDALRKLDRPFVVLVQGLPSTLPARALGADAIVQAFTPGMRALQGHVAGTHRLPRLDGDDGRSRARAASRL
ncbi:hypothetical protein [Streptomyces bobili]|uniref:hypothetical protein n=1 Tax=Streptomyces bobili TaxID=67280 RepID=UPI000A3D584B|nr:hypothetical protein [Streptomyces bobili]